MERRKFLKSSTALLSAIPFLNIGQLVFSNTLHSMENEVVKIKIGNIECTVFRDLMMKYQAKDFFINPAAEELTLSLNKYRLSPDNIPSPFIAVLLQYDDKKVLIDTGAGFVNKPHIIGGRPFEVKGRLQQLMQLENLEKEHITDVVITHFHPDHIGGLFTEDDKLNFPNAHFHIHEEEWNFWHTSKSDQQSPFFKYFIAKNITPLKNLNLNLFKGDFVTLFPGITAVLADGHTPGQIALVIHSGNEHLLYVSDAFLHPLHMERLDWQTNYDLDHQKAKQTRVKLLELAYQENMLINAFHFDFPGLGRVDKSAGSWVWNYTGG